MRRTILTSVLSAVFIACTAEEKAPEPPSTPTAVVQPVPADQAATITGSVSLTGAIPKPEVIKMGSDCRHGGEGSAEPVDTTVLAGAGGELANVFVYVKNFNGKMAPPEQPILLDQKQCMYEPRVSGVQSGQIIQIRNSDPTFHNVHAIAKSNKEFNFTQPTQGAVDIRKFDNQEVMVKLKCDVHPWMKSYVGVVDHPYFAVTDASGRFSIEGLPAGTWELEAWHEKFGVQSQKVTVAAKGTGAATFAFAAK